MYKVKNRTNQAIPILLSTKEGKLKEVYLKARETITINRLTVPIKNLAKDDRRIIKLIPIKPKVQREVDVKKIKKGKRSRK